MNRILENEIAKHILYSFGVNPLNKLKSQSKLLENLLSNKFILEKKMAFEDDNGNKIEKNMWSSQADIEGSKIKILIADISQDIPEYIAAVKFDNSPLICIKFLYDVNDEFGIIVHNPLDNKWLEADTFSQAKILSGIEQLCGLFLTWSKNNDYVLLFKGLIGFLNFEEVSGENK